MSFVTERNFTYLENKDFQMIVDFCQFLTKHKLCHPDAVTRLHDAIKAELAAEPPVEGLTPDASFELTFSYNDCRDSKSP